METAGAVFERISAALSAKITDASGWASAETHLEFACRTTPSGLITRACCGTSNYT
jgi:hypothetical protein